MHPIQTRGLCLVILNNRMVLFYIFVKLCEIVLTSIHVTQQCLDPAVMPKAPSSGATTFAALSVSALAGAGCLLIFSL